MVLIRSIPKVDKLLAEPVCQQLLTVHPLRWSWQHCARFSTVSL